MERFTLLEAAQWTNGKSVGQAEFTNISTDSRKIPENTLFVPLKGERFDAHDFLPTVIQNGVSGIVSHQKNETYSVPALYVENTSQALLDLAGGYRALCGGTVVGVTGSVGKTTTKELIYSVLSEHFRAMKTEGNLNNEVGLPLTLFRMTKETEVMVAEMGMNHFGEISRMTAAAKPNIAVITNIGTSHIEFLGSREGICKAKLEILEGVSQDGYAVLCGDEPLLWEKKDNLGCHTVTYGLENAACDLTAAIKDDGSFVITNNGLCCKTLPIGQTMEANLQIPGAHNVLNALAATAVGLLLGEPIAQIQKGLFSYEASGLRQNIYEQNGFMIFADCYNASPDAMQATLSVLSEMTETGTKFAVLGSMLELGEYAESLHEQVGAAAANYADVLFAYGPYADAMEKGARESGMEQVFVFDNHAALAETLKKQARKGDSLLFKGSRGMQMEKALALFLGEEVKK